jgi:hypothetical protein
LLQYLILAGNGVPVVVIQVFNYKRFELLVQKSEQAGNFGRWARIQIIRIGQTYRAKLLNSFNRLPSMGGGRAGGRVCECEK